MVVAQLAPAALFWPLVTVALGLAVAAFGVRRLRPELRRLRQDPVDVRDAPGSYHPVEVRGTVAPEDHVLEAPLTGTECVAYRWEVEEYDGSGSDELWTTLASDGRFAAFRLEDRTGSILVEPDGDDFEFTRGSTVEVGPDETVVPEVREFLEDRGLEPGEAGSRSVWLFDYGTGDRRRYTEERLEVGERAAVYGPVERDPDAGGEWGSRAVDAAVRRREDDDPLIVADAPSVPTLRRAQLVPAGAVALGALLVLDGGVDVARAVVALLGA